MKEMVAYLESENSENLNNYEKLLKENQEFMDKKSIESPKKITNEEASFFFEKT